MQVEVWSDFACPWCYLGKRQLESALAQFPHADQVQVVWRSFELDPSAPLHRDLSLTEAISHKYGLSPDQATTANHAITAAAAEQGLEYHLDRVVLTNTFNAHRLLHLANAYGLGGALKEELLAAYFTHGADLSDHVTLYSAAVAVGLDPTITLAMLDTDHFATEVFADELRAGDLGITGVPFFLIDGQVAVPGAQGADTILAALHRAWALAHPAALADTTNSSAS
jgi:predicted DsbA family dithiol-disulfide isomerase